MARSGSHGSSAAGEQEQDNRSRGHLVMAEVSEEASQPAVVVVLPEPAVAPAVAEALPEPAVAEVPPVDAVFGPGAAEQFAQFPGDVYALANFLVVQE